MEEGDPVTFTYRGEKLTYYTVKNPITGKFWLDRNIGATQVADAYNDPDAYGHLFQWGRLDDGHQLRNSGTTPDQSPTDVPGHADFIKGHTDWRTTGNPDLWNSASDYTNLILALLNLGFRVPTLAEWLAEYATWVSEDPAGAYASVLKITVCGYRYFNTGSIYNVGTSGRYWSSTPYGTNTAYYVKVRPWGEQEITDEYKAYGMAMRLIYDEELAPPAPPDTPDFTDRNNYNGYLAFVQQYIKNKINGTTPWKNPDGTLIE